MIRKRVKMINNIIIKSRVDDLDLNVNYIMPNTSIRGLFFRTIGSKWLCQCCLRPKGSW